jgi:hypothetical protein
MSPTTYALFSESYTAQYIFVLLLASAVVGVGIFTRQGSDTRSSFVPNKADLAIGALVSPIFAMAAAIYPYHFVLPVACLMIATLLALCRKTTPLRRTVVVGLFSLLLVNIQLLIILRFGDADRFMTTLNDIARHVVFPYFSNFSVFEVAVGVRDHFQFGQAFGGEYFTALKGVVSSLDGVLCYAIAIVFIIGLTRSLISSDFFSATIGLQMVLMVSIAIVLYCTDQPYPFGKMVLSLGFPLVPLVIVGIDRLTLKNSMAMVSIMSLIMFYWLLRSCTSIIMMNVPPLTPPQLSVMRSVRTHVDELPDEIQHIRPLLTTLQGSPSKTVGIIGQPGSLKRTDGDRVIAFAIWHQLQGAVQRYFPEPPLGENAHLGSYQVITTRDVLDGHLRNGDFELLVVMNDELEILPLSRYKMNLKGERFSLLSRSSE